MADKAIAYSKTVCSGCDKDDIKVTILLRLIKIIMERLDGAERTINAIIRLAQDLPNFIIIRSISGIGDNLAARILAEIGDISKFKTYNQLIAYAGTDPRIYESGKDIGEHLHITKKGNKRLSCLMYLAVTCLISLKRDDHKIKDFYKKKR